MGTETEYLIDIDDLKSNNIDMEKGSHKSAAPFFVTGTEAETLIDVDDLEDDNIDLENNGSPITVELFVKPTEAGKLTTNDDIENNDIDAEKPSPKFAGVIVCRFWFLVACFSGAPFSVFFTVEVMEKSRNPDYHMLAHVLTSYPCCVLAYAAYVFGRRQPMRAMGRYAIFADYVFTICATMLVRKYYTFSILLLVGLAGLYLQFHAMIKLWRKIYDFGIWDMLLAMAMQCVVYLAQGYSADVFVTVLVFCFIVISCKCWSYNVPDKFVGVKD